jgi:hypothetical protein
MQEGRISKKAKNGSLITGGTIVNKLAQKKQMTARELARQFGCGIHTITNHANRLFPGKIQNGVKTYFDEREVTLILESIKKPVSSGAKNNLVNEIQGIETALTPALRLEMLYRQIDEIKTAEIARLKQEHEALQTRFLETQTCLSKTQIRLSEAKQWYSVKRVLIETGREYSWKPLKIYSVRHGFAVEKVFDKNYGEVNAYHWDVWNAVYGLEL